MKKEKVNNPDHYNKGGIEVIEFLNSWPNTSFSIGNVVKYAMRAPFKHDTEEDDLQKALWYLLNEMEVKGFLENAKNVFDKKCEKSAVKNGKQRVVNKKK